LHRFFELKGLEKHVVSWKGPWEIATSENLRLKKELPKTSKTGLHGRRTKGFLLLSKRGKYP